MTSSPFRGFARTETRRTTVSLEQLVKEVRDEMQPETSGARSLWRIGALPDLYGDRSMPGLRWSISFPMRQIHSQAPASRDQIGSLERSDAVTVFVKDNGVAST